MALSKPDLPRRRVVCHKIGQIWNVRSKKKELPCSEVDPTVNTSRGAGDFASSTLVVLYIASRQLHSTFVENTKPTSFNIWKTKLFSIAMRYCSYRSGLVGALSTLPQEYPKATTSELAGGGISALTRTIIFKNHRNDIVG